MVPPAWLDRVAYPFAARHAETTAGQIHYVDEGSGEPVLFVHGTPSWSFEFRHLIRALAGTRRCIAPDLLGFGLSDRPAGFAYTPEAHAAVLREFVAALKLDRFALVVHDFGGPIGLPLCLDRPERVSAIVVMNTWMWPLQDDPKMARPARLLGGGVGRLLYRFANLSLRVLVPSSYGDRRRLTPAIHRQYLAPFRRPADRVRVLHPLATSVLGSSAHYADLWRRAEGLRGRPALLVWGEKDPAFGRYLERWERLLPEARVVSLPEAGHWPHEEAPEQVARALVEFLSDRIGHR